jgi:hypothetical protein
VAASWIASNYHGIFIIAFLFLSYNVPYWQKPIFLFVCELIPPVSLHISIKYLPSLSPNNPVIRPF